MLGIATLVWGLVEANGATFSVAYHAGRDCPTQAQLEAAIVARAPGARAAEDAQIRFDVDLAPEPGQKRRLRVELDDGSSQDRTIDADDCAEAAQSMAVIAAMILASRPATTQQPRLPPESEPKLESGPEPEPETEREPGPELEREPRRSPPAAAPSRRKARPTWFAVSAGVGLEGAAAPTPVYAPSASVELGSITGATLAPSLRLSVLYGRAENANTPAGDASFRLALARLHACAVRLGATRAELRLCAVLDAGALLARGIDARNERQQNMTWIGAGLGAIGHVALSRPLQLELAGGARTLFVRDEFIFAPNTTVHQPAVIAWDFRLGIAYRLW
ncbi:MAG: hypothetical protein K0R38_4836 [Polyangiaceae bacterium]|jgi:hypothetical protein|nr:hypothetical protein [Polyangiaceae bacterium]